MSGNDLLRYWEDDEATDVVLLYLESFGNPRGSPASPGGCRSASRSSRCGWSQGGRPFPLMPHRGPDA